MKVYISGKITGNNNFKKEFEEAEKHLLSEGFKVMNPAVLGSGFTWNEYMNICIEMLKVCDRIYMLKKWEESKGAVLERKIAKAYGLEIDYQ